MQKTAMGLLQQYDDVGKPPDGVDGPHSFELEVTHSTYKTLTNAYADRDLEYIRKRMNANRNLRNTIIDSKTSRTYEAMKTLIDTIQTIYGSERLFPCIVIYPRVTCAKVVEGHGSAIMAKGSVEVYVASSPSWGFGCNAVTTDYEILSEFTQEPDHTSEVYRVACMLRIMDKIDGADPKRDTYQWEEIYPINPNDILGYAENFPPPSVFAGRFITELIQFFKLNGLQVNVK